MKGKGILLGLLIALIGAPAAGAAVIAEDTDGADLGHVERIRGVVEVTSNTAMMGQQQCVPFDPGDFLIVDADDAVTVVPLSTSTTPNLALTAAASVAYIEWADGEESPIQKTFRVPSDFYSGGEFNVLLGRSDTAVAPAVDFEVFVNKTVTAFDTSATDQTAIDLTTDIGPGSPEEKALTVTTDFDSLAANDWVTFNLWRDDTNTSTGTLEFYGGEFCYTASQK